MPEDLVRELRGIDVRVDDPTRAAYARDRSPFALTPAAVALPREDGEVAACVAAAAALGMPVTARAGGSSVAGQCLGSGLVVDTSALAGVEPGADDACWAGVGETLDDLNAALAGHGRMIGPDVTSSPVGARRRAGRHERVRLAIAAPRPLRRRAAGGRRGARRRDARAPDRGRPGLARAGGGAHPPRRPADRALAAPAPRLRRLRARRIRRAAAIRCRSSRGRRARSAWSRARCWRPLHAPRARLISRAEFPTLRAAIDAAPACARTGASAVEVLDSHLTGGAPVLLVEHLDDPGGPRRLPAPFELLGHAEGEAAWALRREALARLEAGGITAISLFEDPAVEPERAGAFADELIELLDALRLRRRRLRPRRRGLPARAPARRPGRARAGGPPAARARRGRRAGRRPRRRDHGRARLGPGPLPPGRDALGPSSTSAPSRSSAHGTRRTC